MQKIGRHPEWDIPYEGGWIWKTRQGAEAFITKHPDLDFPAKVYGVRLARGWDVDVSRDPHPDDEVHRLLVDSELFLLGRA